MNTQATSQGLPLYETSTGSRTLTTKKIGQEILVINIIIGPPPIVSSYPVIINANQVVTFEIRIKYQHDGWLFYKCKPGKAHYKNTSDPAPNLQSTSGISISFVTVGSPSQFFQKTIVEDFTFFFQQNGAGPVFEWRDPRVECNPE